MAADFVWPYSKSSGCGFQLRAIEVVKLARTAGNTMGTHLKTSTSIQTLIALASMILCAAMPANAEGLRQALYSVPVHELNETSAFRSDRASFGASEGTGEVAAVDLEWEMVTPAAPTESVSATIPASTSVLTSQATEPDTTPELSEEQRRQRSVQQHLDRLSKPVHQIDMNIDLHSNVPQSRASEMTVDSYPRYVTATGLAPSLPERDTTGYGHRPLYFEEADLERCGTGYGYLTNGASMTHFLCNTAVLPYRIGSQRPDRCVRNGPDCSTCESLVNDFEPLEKSGFDLGGMTATAASLAGFTFLFL
ncbi:hypothetical protein [Stieleria varia]|uniref:Uncharacterized protein n=1 Tax=Stieleria varia TaxID=2528005 RepID=A0A5C6B155_9BACT|nr:hypothetical protein [Stieleria varia]TWU05026.1 hypothetical protein Pla52n_30720 [Stieleria varia]